MVQIKYYKNSTFVKTETVYAHPAFIQFFY